MTNEEFLRSISEEGEEWRIINDTLGYFVISNLGRVVALSRYVNRCKVGGWMTKPHLMSIKINNSGYAVIHLMTIGVDINKTIHRLVAEAFIPNPNNHPHIDHIDGDKTNNVASNLRWVSRSMNMLNPITRMRNSKARIGKPASNKKAVVQLKDGKIVAKYESATDACKTLGLSGGTLCDCCKNQKHTYKGFNWMYLSDWESSHQ